jgi:hypothetical protein
MRLAGPRIRVDEGLATIRSENGGQKAYCLGLDYSRVKLGDIGF